VGETKSNYSVAEKLYAERYLTDIIRVEKP